MSMTRKDYQGAAEVIRFRLEHAPTDGARIAVEQVAADLADVFKRSNSAFKYQTFYRACGFDVPSHHLGRA